MDGDEFVFAVEKHLRIDPPLGEEESPDWLTGAGIDADDIATSGSGIEDGLVAEFSKDGHGKR